MAYQWIDLLEGDPPVSLTDLPCDHWAVKEGPDPATHALLCIACGWYRIIPEGDVPAAQKMFETIEMLFGDEKEE